MNVFRYIILVCCAALDLGLLLFGIVGLFTFVGDSNPSVPVLMVLSWTLGAMVLFGLTTWSFFRTAKGKRLPVMYGFFWKIVTFMLMLSATWFSLETPEAGWLMLALAAGLGALLYFFPKLSGDLQARSYAKAGAGAQGGAGSQASAGSQGGAAPQAWVGSQARQLAGKAVEPPAFRADKAEWAWEDAALEYFRLRGTVYDLNDSGQKKEFQDRISAMQDSETDKIYDYAGMPISYFLGWLIDRDLVSDEFRSLLGPELLQAVKDGTQSPVEVLRDLDYVLARDDIDPKAHRFMDLYYDDGETGSLNKRSAHSAFKHSTHKYFFDYYRAVCSRFDVPRYYCVDFNRGSFHKLSQILDQRYLELIGGGIDEKELRQDKRRLRTRYFDTEAELLYESGTPSGYVQMCAEAYENMGGKLGMALARELQEFCTEDLPDEDVVTEKILSHFHPLRVAVMKPVSEEIPAYVILGESEWEEEHGVAFTVIGDYAVYSSYYADAESPWSEDRMFEYRLQWDAEQGNFCQVAPVPVQLGGDDAGSSRIRMTAAAALRKEEIDGMIEALFTLRMADKYDYKVTYSGNEPSYIYISATKGDVRIFADSIRLK